jgi:hypothetical protein
LKKATNIIWSVEQISTIDQAAQKVGLRRAQFIRWASELSAETINKEYN